MLCTNVTMYPIMEGGGGGGAYKIEEHSLNAS